MAYFHLNAISNPHPPAIINACRINFFWMHFSYCWRLRWRYFTLLRLIFRSGGMMLSVLKKPIGRAIARMTIGSKTAEEIFTDIYRGNKWKGKNSVSGRGSDDDQTKIIAIRLPAFLKEIGVRSMLDVPCGDFHWMRNIDLSGIDYTGADIVAPLIQENTRKYGTKGYCIKFQKLDLLKDDLPEVDLIFCRDCLVHFSHADVFVALENICRSNSKYLLTTHFHQTQSNRDIVTGQWRALNLEAAPFYLPAPISIINEGCTEDNGCDKSLSLWDINDVRRALP